MDQSLLTYSNYKEPLKAIPKRKGFGYYGTVALTKDGSGVQCHICGKIFVCLSGHIWQSHKIAVREYKKQFELAPTTALVSEVFRQELKQKTLDWIKSLTPEEKAEYKQNAIAANRERGFDRIQPKITLETKNKRGACPDQLLQKIKDVKEKLGRVPSKGEFIVETGGQRFTHLIRATFGSWGAALKMLGYEQRKSTGKSGLVRKKGENKFYEDEELLEILKIYQEVHGKPPTHTDIKRGLIPGDYAYKRFGGLTKARELAGIEMPTLKKGYRGGYTMNASRSTAASI